MEHPRLSDELFLGFSGVRFGEGEVLRGKNKGKRCQVALTPTTTTHPLFVERTNSAVRGIDQFRSFSFIEDRGLTSKVVKGGDVLNKESVRNSLNRVRNKQIPGGGAYEALAAEFDAAEYLSGRAKSLLERETFTEQPISIMRIDKVPNEYGVLVPVQEFMNSDAYSPQNDSRRAVYGLDKVKLGDLFFSQNKLTLAEYVYRIKGLNIRANELYGLIMFDEANYYAGQDPLFTMESGPLKYGVWADSMGHSKDTTIRSVYRLLDNEYGSNTISLLPSGEINDDNYLEILHQLPASVQKTGQSEIVLDDFIDKVTEVAVLAHSDGRVFSPKDKQVGGSLMARNVTYAGVVLDLDTMRTMDGGVEEWAARKDFEEMACTVACMARLVETSYSGWLVKLFDQYSRKMNQWGKNSEYNKKMISSVMIDRLEPRVIKRVKFSR